ncbi:MAG: RNA polymerase-binding protein DksA [Woeseiaceae bacterium]
MAARITVSKKRKKVGATRKKAASRRPVSRKKTAGKKQTVSKKKSSAKKSAKKKVMARKKPAAKKAASRKKVSRKKPAARKQKTSKKKVTQKKVAQKKVAKKKTLKKKAASKKRIVKKKLAARKAPSKKKSVAKKRPIRTKAPARRARRRSDLLSGPIHGVSPYAARRGEEYMSNGQLEHFEDILAAWKHELMNEVDRTVHHMRDEAANFPDPNDRATQESEFGLELRTRDRERKLLRKIDSALNRVEDGSYGFCEETGEEIGLQRLEARPVATLCVEAQERRELAERQFRDRDDRYR